MLNFLPSLDLPVPDPSVLTLELSFINLLICIWIAVILKHWG
jgi:hypothetical protein